MKHWILILISFALLVGCSDNRPGPAEAIQQFEQLYPNVTVVDLKVTEDEVVAISYRFIYRKQGETETKSIAIQFMEEPKTREWIPRPPPPEILP